MVDGDPVLARGLCDRVELLLADGALPAPATKRLRGAVRDIRATMDTSIVVGGDAGSASPTIDPMTLFRRIEHADETGSDSARVAARLDYVADVLVPGRELDLAHLLLREIDHLTTNPAEQARAATWQQLPDVLLGKAAGAQDAVARLTRMAPDLPGEVAHDVALLDCLVAHQIGRADLPQLLSRLGRPGSGHLGIDATTVVARILVARERPGEAQAMLALAPTPVTALDRQLRGLLRGTLEARLGRGDEALATLRRTRERALAEGCRLLLPELITQLIVLEAATDREAALHDFEDFDQIVGGGRSVGVEDIYRLIARAAIRSAAGEPARAVDQWTAATELAAGLQHPLLTARCHLAAAQCLEQLGRHGEAQVHRSLSGRYFRQGGLPSSPNRRYGLQRLVPNVNSLLGGGPPAPLAFAGG